MVNHIVETRSLQMKLFQFYNVDNTVSEALFAVKKLTLSPNYRSKAVDSDSAPDFG